MPDTAEGRGVGPRAAVRERPTGTPMAAPETTDALLDLVRKSGLVEAARLDEYLATSTDFPATPNEAARALVRDGLVTLFQAGQLLNGKWRGFVLGKYRVLE